MNFAIFFQKLSPFLFHAVAMYCGSQLFTLLTKFYFIYVFSTFSVLCVNSITSFDNPLPQFIPPPPPPPPHSLPLVNLPAPLLQPSSLLLLSSPPLHLS